MSLFSSFFILLLVLIEASPTSASVSYLLSPPHFLGPWRWQWRLCFDWRHTDLLANRTQITRSNVVISEVSLPDGSSPNCIHSHVLLHGHTHGHSPKWRPMKKWIDNIRKDCVDMDISLYEASFLTSNRTSWKNSDCSAFGLPMRGVIAIVERQ